MSAEQQPDAKADSSSATPSSSPVDIEALHTNDPAAYEHWKLTGEAPKSDAQAASSADKAATEQPASTDAKAQAASDAAAPNKGTTEKPEDYKAKTKARMDELLRENADLKRLAQERDRVADPPKPKAEATDPTTPDLKTFIDKPDPAQPLVASEKFFETFPDATWDQFQLYLVNHRLESRDHAQRQTEHQRQADAARETRVKDFVERISDPAFVESLIPDVLNLTPAEFLPPGEPRTARNVLAQEIMESEHSKALMQGLTVEDLAAVDALTSVPAVIRFVARLESRVAGSTAPAVKKVAPSKTVSDAPAPGTEIGSKARTPNDPIAQAIADDDFVKYRDLANAQEMAKNAK